MKKIGVLLLVFTISAFSLLALGADQFNYEEFRAKRVAYITSVVDLTPAEAEKFWPVYNELEQKKFVMIQGMKEVEKQMDGKIDNLSDQEYIELSKKITSLHKIEGELDVEYNAKYLKILPPRKVVQLYVAEKNFKNHLLQEYKKCDNQKKKDDK